MCVQGRAGFDASPTTRLVRRSKRLLDDQTIAKVRVLQLDTALGLPYRKEMEALSEFPTVVCDLRERGVDIHEYPKRIVKSGQDSIQVRKGPACLSVPSPQSIQLTDRSPGSQPIRRAPDPASASIEHMGVHHRRAHILVAQKFRKCVPKECRNV